MSTSDTALKLMIEQAFIKNELKTMQLEDEYFTGECDMIFDNGDGKTQFRFTTDGDMIMESKTPASEDIITIGSP